MAEARECVRNGNYTHICAVNANRVVKSPVAPQGGETQVTSIECVMKRSL